jgi:NAD(P)H-dependent FMN reductase
MKKILAFTGSNHSKSINKQLTKYAVSLVPSDSFEVKSILLEDY